MAAQNEPTAAAIRDIAEALAGVKTVGVAKRVRDPKGRAAYRLDFPGGFLVCAQDEGGWMAAISHDETMVGIWSNVPSDSARNGGQLIDLIFELGEEERAVFEKQFTTADLQICRKLYATGRGPVWMHTRPNERGTEGVLELPDGTFLRYQWDRATSAIRLDEAEMLDARLF